MSHLKNSIIIVLCFMLLMPLVACGGSKDGASGERIVPEELQYTFWLRAGNQNYADYNENPGIGYLESLSYGKDEQGNDKYIDLSFTTPVSGSEADNFNTLIATGDYMDVMDLSAYSGKATDLYEEGVALDITEWVENYMPHYMAILNANPDLKATATNIIDGEPRFVQLYIYLDKVPIMWGGFQYRRDWIVKYGKNPVDGSAFKGEYVDFKEDGTPDPDSWQDNVIFPSGGPDPVYISDWEWMFGIFDLAMEDLGITDGYGMSLYYPGYLETGDLVSAFGGGNATWHKTPENKIVYGGTSDTLRTYLQAMYTWYKNGWIDKAFPEHTADIFYAIDTNKIYSGKVGLWYGTQATMGGRMANPDDPNLNGFVSFTAAQPINDVYGSESQQNKPPYAMYQANQESVSYIVTTAAEEKDLETLFTFLDFMYDPKGGAPIRSFGLSKEQYELTQNQFMTDNGVTEGAYTMALEADGVTRYQFNETVIEIGDGAFRPDRLPGLNMEELRGTASFHPDWLKGVRRWTQYKNTGWLPGSFTGQLTEENAKTYSKVNTNVAEFMTKNVPSFIKGVKDPYNDEDWKSFVNALNKYGPDKVTVMLQSLADTLYGN